MFITSHNTKVLDHKQHIDKFVKLNLRSWGSWWHLNMLSQSLCKPACHDGVVVEKLHN